MIEIGDLYRIIAGDYISIGYTYIDDHGNTRTAFGPIELYPYKENEYFHGPNYKEAEYKGYLEEDQIVTVLDVIENVSKNTSKLHNKTYICERNVHVVFLLNEQKYIFEESFFLEVARKLELND